MAVRSLLIHSPAKPVLSSSEEIAIDHAGTSLPVTFVRSARARRVSLRVDPVQRRILLTAPLRMPFGVALRFAETQASWIAARLKRLPARRPFIDGAQVPLFGVPHRLRHRPDMRGTVWLEGDEIHVAGHVEHLSRRLRDWLGAELRHRATSLAHAKAARVERPVKRVSVRDSRTRWGSCGPDGGLSFSWRLVLAPPEVLDYLVAHEVAHLVHKNHGPRFWALAERLCDGPMDPPRAWLKGNGETLLQYGA